MDFTTKEYLEALPPGIEKEETRYIPLSFTGSAGEYFRIWIVNILLTLLTLGIYGAWAKVRTRRYFYANTLLDGQPFDYLAKPVAILKGHLIVGVMLILFLVAQHYSEPAKYLVLGIGFATLPLLLFQAHRFKANNSAYRNIRFGFLGSALEAYKAYAYLAVVGVMLLLLSALSVGTELSSQIPSEQQSEANGNFWTGFIFLVLFLGAYSYFMFLRRRYLHNNLAYGKTSSSFKGRVKPFFRFYFGAIIAVFLASIALGNIFVPISEWLNRSSEMLGNATTLAAALLLPLVAFLLGSAMQANVYARVFNYSWSRTEVGLVGFDVTVDAFEFVWLRVTNLLAMMFSLGLLLPWAKVRRARYILSHTTVVLSCDIDAFQTAAVAEESALGETAADTTGWDVGW